jgi:hypothetical protein
MASSSEPSDRPLRRISSWKVFGVFCLVVFLFLLGVLFIPWDVQAPDDSDLHYTPPTLDADKNAFTYFEVAGKLQVVRFSREATADWEWNNLASPIGSSWEKWDPVLADEVLAVNEATFKEIEAGLACERYASPQCQDFTMPRPGFQKYKELVVLQALKSKRAQLAGDPVAAAHVASQAWRLGQLVTDDANYLIEWLVGIACQSIALSRMNEIIADVKTPEPVLRDLLAQLDRWNPQGIERGYKQAMQEEYRFTKVTVEMLQHGKAGKILGSKDPAVYSYCVPYCLKTNMMARMTVPFYRNLIENIDRVYAKTNFDYPGKPKQPVNVLDKAALYISPNCAGKVMFLMWMPAFDKAITRKCLVQANVAGLRLKIALRLYEQKHGQLPDDLNALVPEFIKEIPQDPYDGKPFRYSKTEKKVWAIGYDLVDNGGSMRNDTEMVDGPRILNCDVGIRLGTREMKPTPAPPPAAPGSKPEENPF